MTVQRIYPDFLQEFACKCGDCRRTCCRDWEVRLSKLEYQAARSDKSGPECRVRAKKYLRRNPHRQGDEDYALCAMRPDGFCSFLMEDRLCAWKKLSGEGLCVACNSFPNTYISFLGNEYVFPSGSCEAIVELLLHKTDAVRLVSENLSQRGKYYSATIEQKNFERRPLLELYPELIKWGLVILQDRRFCLDDRMVLLANAMSRVDWMERNNRVGELPVAMDRFLEETNLQHVVHQYDQYAIGPQAILTMNGNAFLPFIHHAAYQEYAQRVLGGLGIETVETEEDGHVQCRLKMVDSQKYLQRKEILAAFMRQKEIFLEHVVVCEYLRSMMPVTEPSVWDNFKFFNVCYALLKGILLGSFDAPPRDTETVDAIMVIHRMFIHNYEAYHHVLEHLEAMQHGDLMSMVALAKG